MMETLCSRRRARGPVPSTWLMVRSVCTSMVVSLAVVSGLLVRASAQVGTIPTQPPGGGATSPAGPAPSNLSGGRSRPGCGGQGEGRGAPDPSRAVIDEAIAKIAKLGSVAADLRNRSRC